MDCSGPMPSPSQVLVQLPSLLGLADSSSSWLQPKAIPFCWSTRVIARYTWQSDDRHKEGKKKEKKEEIKTPVLKGRKRLRGVGRDFQNLIDTSIRNNKIKNDLCFTALTVNCYTDYCNRIHTHDSNWCTIIYVNSSRTVFCFFVFVFVFDFSLDCVLFFTLA